MTSHLSHLIRWNFVVLSEISNQLGYSVDWRELCSTLMSGQAVLSFKLKVSAILMMFTSDCNLLCVVLISKCSMLRC